MTAWLEHQGERRPLDEGTHWIGSSERAWWCITGAGLSPRHLELFVRDGAHVVAPHSLDTVVLVNGHPIATRGHALQDGDVVDAGTARFFYRLAIPETMEHPVHAHRAGDAPEAWLVDDAAHTAHPLALPLVRIGRDPQSEVLVRDATVSRHHASVRQEAGRHVLHVTGSTGARVNGMRIGAAHVLDAGDRIEIGMRVFRYATGTLPAGVAVYAGHDPALEGHDALRRTTETMAAVDAATLAAATRRISSEGAERADGERSEPRGPSRVAIAVAIAVVLGTVALALAL